MVAAGAVGSVTVGLGVLAIDAGGVLVVDAGAVGGVAGVLGLSARVAASPAEPLFPVLGVALESDESEPPPLPPIAAAANTAKPTPAALMRPMWLLLPLSAMPTSSASGKSLAGTSVTVAPSAAA